MRGLVFSKLLKLVGRGKEKTIAEQIKSQPDGTDELMELIDALPFEDKVGILQTGEALFTPEGWKRFILHLTNQGFPQRFTTEIKRNGSSLSVEFIGSLTKFPTEAVVEVLIDLLATKNEFIRFEATQALINLEDPIVVQRLLRVLGHPKQWIPARVTEILISYSEVAAQEIILAFETADSDTQVLLLEILTTLNDPQAEELFLSCLVREDPRLRSLAITGLGVLGKVEQVIINAIKDPNPSVRLKTVQIMENSEDPSVYNYFWVALLDENWLVRSKAAEALIDRGLLPGEVMQMVRQSRDNPDILPEIFKVTGDLNQGAFIWRK